jgi:hypothetical protein
MTNQRERQTYFGTLNYQTKEFFVREYEAGNSKNEVWGFSCSVRDCMAIYLRITST